jgi:acyl-CoA thioesterase
MCLAAAQRTVSPDFVVHSCHCYFLLAGSSELPILFHVEQVRDGRSFATRTVQARQRGRCIFTTTVSFTVRTEPSSASASASGSRVQQVSHSSEMPCGADGKPLQPPPDDYNDEPDLSNPGPFQGTKIEIVNRESDKPGEKKTRQWIRARGKIAGGMPAHLEALAYVSDSYFIGTITRIHKLWRFPFKAEEFDSLPEDLQRRVKSLHQWEGMGEDPREMVGQPVIGMMVSLDHTIYFHNPSRVRADEWMLNEMESPWAGDGRGVVTQKIFSKDGTLLATCVQEVRAPFLAVGSSYISPAISLTELTQGLVRLQQPKPEERKESKL